MYNTPQNNCLMLINLLISVSNITLTLTPYLSNNLKKKKRRSRWTNANRTILNKEKIKKKQQHVKEIRICKSTYRLDEKKRIYDRMNTTLKILDSASTKTKGTIRYSHRLVNCLDDLENASKELKTSEAFHDKSGALRYRSRKNNSENTTIQRCKNDGLNHYNLRKKDNQNTKSYKDEVHSESSSSSGKVSSCNEEEEYIPIDNGYANVLKYCKAEKNPTKALIHDESDDEGSSNISLLTYISNKWVYDLKAMDNDSQPFFSKCLVIIRGNHKQWENKDWDEISNLDAKIIKIHIQEIICIQRNDNGQMYVVQGLQNSLHFSVGMLGTRSLIELCSQANIKIWKGSSTSNKVSKRSCHHPKFIPKGLYIKSMKQGQLTTFETTYKKLMMIAADGLWSTLFGVSLLH